MNHAFDDLKNRLHCLAVKRGCIFENDYHQICCEVTDDAVISQVGDWLISSGLRLRRGVGEQYKQELVKRLKHPNVDDVKDTKHRTHKNTDKEQESKRKHLKTCVASQHLNHVIEELKAMNTQDEFLPTWEKRQAAKIPPSMREVVTELMQYIRGHADSIPNWREWLHYLPTVDDGAKIMRLWDQVAREDYEIPTEEQQTPPLIPKYDEPQFINLPDDEEGPPLELQEDKKAAKLAAVQDPVEEHIRSVAKEEYTSKLKKKVKFDNDVVYKVDIAESPAQKAAGLEIFEALPPGFGLLFPFEKPDHVTFHMGKVRFPIDILFLMQDDRSLRVAKIIHNALPGTLDLWSYPHTACVLELPGGTCLKDKIEVNSYCQVCED